MGNQNLLSNVLPWPMNCKGQFDIAIVFGYGPVLPGTAPGSGRLNEYGRINALATGMLYQACETGVIILTGGRTGGTDRPSEAELMSQVIKSRFDVPESTFILEEKATNTLLNVIYTANIIDKFAMVPNNLLFVAMGFHIPRIREICALVGLDGYFIAAETVVSMRSWHHRCLLSKLLDHQTDRSDRVPADQKRWLRGLKETPEYWVPYIAMVENVARLRRILEAERIQPFLRRHGVDVTSESPGNLRAWLRSIPRKLPEP